MIAIGFGYLYEAIATPRMTPRTFTSPSWLPRMKSESRLGCACLSASASSLTLRQNAKRVAMDRPGELGEGAHEIRGFCIDLPERLPPPFRPVRKKGFC